MMKSQERSQRGILLQIEVWNLQESFVYFKIFKPKSWEKSLLSAAADWFRGFHDFQTDQLGQKAR